MKKKLLSLLLVLAMVSSLLIACGGSGEKETEAGVTDASKETESVAEETKGEEEEETEDTKDTGS